MNIAHPDYNVIFPFENGVVTELIIENPSVFYLFTKELLNQADGGEGRFVLSEGLDIKDFGVYSEYIATPYNIEINSRKIIKKLYSFLKTEILSTELLEIYGEISMLLSAFIGQLSKTVDYRLDYEIPDNPEELLKYLKVKIASENAESITESIIDFIRVISGFLDIKLLIFINIRSYVDESDLKCILKEASYRDMRLFLIECHEKIRIPGSRRFIIDNDICEIYD